MPNVRFQVEMGLKKEPGLQGEDTVSFLFSANKNGVLQNIDVYKRQVEECGYAYRNSIFKRPENKSVFVTHVCFRLSKEEHYMLDYGTIRQELEK